MGTYYLVSHAGMIWASETADKNEKNREGRKEGRGEGGGWERERDCMYKEDALKKRRWWLWLRDKRRESPCTMWTFKRVLIHEFCEGRRIRVYWTVINGARRRRSFLTGSPPIWKRVSRDYVYFLYVTLYTVYRGDTRFARNNTEIFTSRWINEAIQDIYVSDHCKSRGEVISLPLTVIYSLRYINTSKRL